jgi:hypothetical protein
MFIKYFEAFDNRLLGGKQKKGKAPSGKAGSKSAGKAKKPAVIDRDVLMEELQSIVPQDCRIVNARPIDSSGFSPDGADLIAYNPCCKNIINIMGGYVPSEMVTGAFFIENHLDKKSLIQLLNRIAAVKKLGSFTDAVQNEQDVKVPSFVIVRDSEYDFRDLKNDIINHYMAHNILFSHEMDIMMILKHGIVVKNWREKRSYIALETKSDTSMRFFILMNEYLEAGSHRSISLDLRAYMKDVIYPEY